MTEEDIAKSIIEALDLKLKPIRDDLDALSNRLDEQKEALDAVKAVVNKNATIQDDNIKVLEHKFIVSSRLFDSIFDAIEKLHHDAKRCEDDVKGVKLLKGEPFEVVSKK